MPRLKRSSPPRARDARREPEGLVSGDIVADRYRLEDVIGRGGMGEVWAAFDRKLGRRVAIKLVALDGADGVEKSRFKREAEISRQLRGPSFVEVYDQGMEGNQAFLVMELLEGETLHERLRRVGTLTLEETLHLLRSVATCLRLAHTLQIVHRDLKPGNVFFARSKPGHSGVQSLDGRSEIVKLFDFGIAKDAWDDARLTRPGVLLGSAFYMSPEQVRSGRDVDARSDLWSLGVIMYRAVTGQRPFPGAAAEALAHILNDEPPSVCSLSPSLPHELDAFFRKALDKEAIRRFQSIDEMLDAFSAAIRGEQLESESDDGRSVLEAIDRLGRSSRPPRGQREAAPARAATFSEPPTVITPAEAPLELAAPQDPPSEGSSISESAGSMSLPSAWLAERPRAHPQHARFKGWTVLAAPIVIALVAGAIVLARTTILEWARLLGLLPG